MIRVLIRRIWLFLSQHIDQFLLAVVSLTLLLGLVVLYSASGENWSRVSSQASSMLLALSLMWIVGNVPPQHLMRFAWPTYLAGLLLLVAVALFGEVSKGARRWLDLGVARIQPSELMKIAVPLMLAWYFEKREKFVRLSDYLIAAVLLMIPVGLIAKQPDLGTALLIAASGFYVLFLAGIGWKIIVGLTVAGGAMLPVAWSLMHDYQRQRILTLIDPSQDPLGAGYHTIQSSIALGSGGILGKGYLEGSQAHLDFLPERHTDFIFAVFGEEFGLIGIVVLMILYLLIVARGLYIAANAPSLFARLLAGSVTLTFATYAFVNMGMVSGILPVVGVPLPLISYGGTAMVTLLLGFGILMSVATHKRLVKQ
jgi:rod shape determining protein RodA